MGIGQRKILRAESLWKEYATGKNLSLQVLKGVDLEVEAGEVVVIVGPSGSGKSTLLHLLGGLDRPTTGKVLIQGEDISLFPEERLAAFRNHTMGFIFQFHHLLPEFSALENVALPALIQGRHFAEAQTRAAELLAEVGLEERIHHKPNELSGGEQQRVAIARALINTPQLILADEPSGNLDSQTGDMLHSLIFSLQNKRGLTFIIATHNPDLAKRATRVLRLAEGKLWLPN